VEQHAPLYAGMMPLGNVADDGSGIELGVAVGAATDRMDRCSAWK
jgi:3-oxo-5alpha-steroid 4-dehydrogenase